MSSRVTKHFTRLLRLVSIVLFWNVKILTSAVLALPMLDQHRYDAACLTAHLCALRERCSTRCVRVPGDFIRAFPDTVVNLERTAFPLSVVSSLIEDVSQTFS